MSAKVSREVLNVAGVSAPVGYLQPSLELFVHYALPLRRVRMHKAGLE